MKTKCWTGWGDISRCAGIRADHDGVVCAVCVISRKTAFGRSVFAVGGNATGRSCAVLTFVGYAFLSLPFRIISGGDRHFVGGAPRFR